MTRLAALLPLLVACNTGGDASVMWTDAVEWSVRDGGAGCMGLPGELCDGILAETAPDPTGPARNALTTDLRLPLGMCAARIDPATGEASHVTGCVFTVTAQDTRTAYRVDALFRSARTTASTAARFVTATWAITARWTEASSGAPRIVTGTYLTSSVFSPLR